MGPTYQFHLTPPLPSSSRPARRKLRTILALGSDGHHHSWRFLLLFLPELALLNPLPSFFLLPRSALLPRRQAAALVLPKSPVSVAIYRQPDTSKTYLLSRTFLLLFAL